MGRAFTTETGAGAGMAVDLPALRAARPPAPPPSAGRKLLAVSSGGGHWVELSRLVPAFAGLDVVYASPDPSAQPPDGAAHHVIRNVTRRDRWGFVVLAWQLRRLLLDERPDVVLTTGAAPGLVALALAKLLLGCRTIWIDSIASAARLSLSARLARPVADAWLVQWPHLARAEGPEFWGAVL